jgi:hypothetical protein
MMAKFIGQRLSFIQGCCIMKQLWPERTPALHRTRQPTLRLQNVFTVFQPFISPSWRDIDHTFQRRETVYPTKPNNFTFFCNTTVA